MKKLSLFLVSLLVCLFAGMLVAYVSTNLQNRFAHREESIQNHYAILHGEDFYYDGSENTFPNFYGRVLSPYMMTAFAEVGNLSETEAYLLTRIICAFMAILFFSLAVGALGRPEDTVMAAGSVSLLMLCFVHGAWEEMSDYLDIGFFSLYVFIAFALLKKRTHFWAASFALVAVASLNRESAAYFGILAFFLTVPLKSIGTRERLVSAFLSASMCVFSYALNNIVRALHGGVESIGSQTITLPTNARLMLEMTTPRPFFWRDFLFSAILFSIIPLVLRYRSLDKTSKDLFLGALSILAISPWFGRIDEPRVFAPAFTVGLAVLVHKILAGQKSSIIAPYTTKPES